MTAYKLNEEKMFADITDGVAIVINSETGIYYGMDEWGTAVFAKLLAGATPEEIAAALQQLPNMPADVAAQVQTFVAALTEKEIITADDGSAGAVALDFGEITAPFALNVSEYSDAQELLMADPIHEVKEELGWTPERDSIGYSKEETREREKKMQE